jgi:hypothetical protein
MKDSAPFREFSRELLLRFERLTRELRADNERLSRDLRADRELAREESRRYFEALDARLADLHAESRAHTSALLAALDRLNGGGAAPAT